VTREVERPFAGGVDDDEVIRALVHARKNVGGITADEADAARGDSRTREEIFGRLLVEKKGEHRGKLDLKKGGIFALTRGISLIALESGFMGGTTWAKLERLHHLQVISDHDLEIILNAFTFLLQMRLRTQMSALLSGNSVDNCVDPAELTDRERDLLREAFKGVETLLDILNCRYQLDLLAQ
jgi:CBS domain-containing protein